MTIILPPLPYKMDALQPYLSQETLSYHYDKHHQTYVKNLNNLILNSKFEGKTLEDIIKQAPVGSIFNNAAQIWNHTFYWNSLSPNSTQEPTGHLVEAITHTFGSLSQFKEQFNKVAISTFGSGWTWLIKDVKNNLKIISTNNANTPLKEGLQALFTCDVWEHAYYIDYRNARPKYLDAFWHLINWNFATQNFQEGD